MFIWAQHSIRQKDQTDLGCIAACRPLCGWWRSLRGSPGPGSPAITPDISHLSNVRSVRRCGARAYLLRGVSVNHVVHHGNLAVQQRRELQHLVRHHHGDVHSWSLPLRSRCGDTQNARVIINRQTHLMPFTPEHQDFSQKRLGTGEDSRMRSWWSHWSLYDDVICTGMKSCVI